MNRQIYGFLMSILSFAQLAKTFLSNFDSNKTGFDDDFARWLEDVLIKEINLFIQSHPLPEDTVARGYSETASFCSNVLQSVKLLVTSRAPKDQRMIAARDLIDSLTDPTKIYPAKKGKDHDLIISTLEECQRKFDEISKQTA